MKLIIFEGRNYSSFYPIAYLRPTFELRCGQSLLYEKILRNHPGLTPAFFCREHLKDTFASRAPHGSSINDPAALDDSLLIFNGNLLAGDFRYPASGPDEVCLSPAGEVLCARISRAAAAGLPSWDIHSFLDAASAVLPKREMPDLTLIRHQWELIQRNPAAIDSDFTLRGQSGIAGTLHPSVTVYGPAERLYVAPEALVHPQVVLDTSGGSITIEPEAVVFPHSRIEGPCYIGPGTQILRGNIREGCSFGPVCRAGGEVEESIMHGYTNKFHEGFLGHAYVCEWVNLGALTTNSDLKNDYSAVEMFMQDPAGAWSFVDTQDTKVGCYIGDHTKTSIGTFLNTGSHIGVMTLLMGNGKVLPKFIPSFAWFLEGAVNGGYGYKNLLKTAEVAMSRRQRSLSDADRALLDHVYALTAPERQKAIRKDRKKLLGK
jgi:UDP-N-acetylglucosamine diphosphorylase / glucose-1-phosphate thymidylyltransferase / UDP-N-acetylgalactosamine diphosphorylase / glucosamine-1-phosphate N-acetyltransferase / galactosamine-1-phosphate N-acetyltransferase